MEGPIKITDNVPSICFTVSRSSMSQYYNNETYK